MDYKLSAKFTESAVGESEERETERGRKSGREEREQKGDMVYFIVVWEQW